MKSSPEISRRYSFTSAELILWVFPASSTHSNSSWPGKSWHRFTTRDSLVSNFDSVVFPALAAKAKLDVRPERWHGDFSRWSSRKTRFAGHIPRCPRGSELFPIAARWKQELFPLKRRVYANHDSLGGGSSVKLSQINSSAHTWIAHESRESWRGNGTAFVPDCHVPLLVNGRLEGEKPKRLSRPEELRGP